MKSSLGEKIKQLRLNRKMTQSDVAKAVGVSGPIVVCKWEKDKAVPSDLNLYQLSVLFQDSSLCKGGFH